MRAAAAQWWAAEAEAEAEFTRLEESLVDKEDTLSVKTIVEAARYRMAKGEKMDENVHGLFKYLFCFFTYHYYY